LQNTFTKNKPITDWMIMKIYKRENGFTIMELLLVTIVIAILAALAVPNFDHAVKKVRFKSASNTLMSSLRMARSNAISTKVQHGVEFNADGRVLRVYRDDIDPGSFIFDTGDSVILEDTLEMSFGTLNSTFTDGTVFFFPDGRASASGYVQGEKEFNGTQAAVFISVLAATGRVRIDSLTY